MFKSWKFWVIVLFLAALAVRLYNAQELFFWHIDEDIYSLTARRILIEGRPMLIGYPIPGGIYLGPILPYIISFFYLISGMNPFNLPFFSALFGTLATILVYKVGSTILESKRAGFMAAFIWGFSALTNIYSRVFTVLIFIPIYTLLVYFILYKNIKLKKPIYLFWIGIVLLLAAQSEGTSLSLIVLTFFVWLIYRFRIPSDKILQIIILFVIFHLPIAIFEFRHDFFISKSFLNFFSKNSQGSGVLLSFESLGRTLTIFPQTLARFWLISGKPNISAQILPCSDLLNSRTAAIPMITFIGAVAFILFFLIRQILTKQRKIGNTILFVHMLIIFLGIIVYNLFFPGWIYEWMLVIFFPAFALILGYTFDWIYGWHKLGRIVVIILLGIFLIYNLRFLIKTRDNFGLSAKASAVKYALSQIGNRPFYLDSIGSCYAQGYNYLFWYFGNFPKQSYSDDMFTPTYYQRSSEPKPKLGVVMVNPSRAETNEFYQKYENYRQRAKISQYIGDIEVLIVEDR